MTTVSIPKTSTGVTDPFWPAQRKRLEVTFETPADALLIARGHDPDSNALAFCANLQPGQREAFLGAVRAGVAGTPVTSNENIAADRTVVITGTGSGDGVGPRFLVKLSP